MPEIKFDPKLEELISKKRKEIEQKILSCECPLSIEDFAALVWEHMQQKYPAKTKDMDLLEAICALRHEVIELISQDKLFQYDWVPTPTHGRGFIFRFKARLKT